MALLLVSDYVAAARVLLQDLVQPYRYGDDDIVSGLNMAFVEMDRLRPDIAIALSYTGRVLRNRVPGVTPYPTYNIATETATVVCPSQYQNAVLYYAVGQAQLRDTEDTQDNRASAFITMFTSELLAVAPPAAAPQPARQG